MWQAAQLERSLLGQYNGCGLCESRAGRCETLDLEIYAKNLELNDQAQKYIHKKFERLKRHLKPIRDARLEVSQDCGPVSGRQDRGPDDNHHQQLHASRGGKRT